MTDILEQMKIEGYVVFRSLFNQRETAELARVCEGALARFRCGDAGKSPDGTYLGHLNCPEYFAEHRDVVTLLATIADDRILNLMRTFFHGEEPLFFTSALFYNPLSGMQEGCWHRDTQFSFTDPEKEKDYLLSTDPFFGLQFQIALVPTEDTQYVPGSHLRWDTPEEFEIRLANEKANQRSDAMPGALRFRMEPGDAVDFMANGLHRGRYHSDKLRRTLMPTYSRLS